MHSAYCPAYHPNYYHGHHIVLDECYDWGEECGSKAAEEFCRRKGKEYVSHKTSEYSETRILKDGEVCHPNWGSCNGYSEVKCQEWYCCT